MSEKDQKIDPATAEEAGAAPADQAETAAEARETDASGVRKVNLRDMPPSQKDEVGGPRGPEPTRYGDWERKGRVSDF
ncbi:succinate dehydrogenase assembly factor 4 [Caenispirillum salinarum]|uniref:succinate dehydrogenase assembly factor 4 n=1 Tax=Caenispirillum salinarum TaxID=859058 RepID=UPI00384E8C04